MPTWAKWLIAVGVVLWIANSPATAGHTVHAAVAAAVSFVRSL